MRQLRVAAGDDLPSAVVILNEVIASLYPAANPAEPGKTGPRPVTRSFLTKVEKGHHSRLDLGQLPKWTKAGRHVDKTRLYTSRVPEWLVRAYDVAFCADGYLVDMAAWSAALLPDQLRDTPRRLRDLPAHVRPGAELAFFAEHFPDAGERISAVLAAQARAVTGLRDRRPPRDAPWLPTPGDRSTSVDETAEGLLVPPDGQFVAAWELHNIGTVPWRDRLLYRIGAYEGGVRTPPFVVVPDTAPGSAVRIEVPMRAPATPGTYRACLKMGWPDGTYCLPNTLLGLFVTMVVPPGDLVEPATEWAGHGG